MDGKLTAMEGERCDIPRTERACDVTVLMGGPSAEREVSLVSGTAIAEGLQRAGHRVTRADISPADVSALDREDLEVVFIALHGLFGESGEVQKLCEARGLPYTGSGRRASELAMDKAAAKQLFKRAGLATPDWMIVEEFHPPEMVAEWLEQLPPPVVVKPVDGGSSVDVTIALNPAARDAAMEDVLDRYSRVMVERFVQGRELTVGILGARALPLLEIVPTRGFYDYTAKYADDAGTEYRFDHGLNAETVRRIQEEALAAHNVIGCRDMSRVDFLLDAQGVSHVLEVNTIPGFTGHSLLPMAAREAGIEFEQLVDALVAMAARRGAGSGG